MKDKPIYVVIPAFNEERSIGHVVEGLRKLDMDLNIIVVDDGSKDNTGVVARKAGAEVIRHDVNLGQWAALRTAFTVSSLDNADVVVTLDGDGQHSPDNLWSVVSPILKGEADLVVGSRFMEYGKPVMQTHRFYGIKFFNLLLNLITGLRLSDCTCGYKAYAGKCISDIFPHLDENQYGALESIVLASKRGARIHESPVTSIPSNKTSKGRLRYAFNLLRTIVKQFLS